MKIDTGTPRLQPAARPRRARRSCTTSKSAESASPRERRSSRTRPASRNSVSPVPVLLCLGVEASSGLGKPPRVFEGRNEIPERGGLTPRNSRRAPVHYMHCVDECVSLLHFGTRHPEFLYTRSSDPLGHSLAGCAQDLCRPQVKKRTTGCNARAL
jgi:hypothetical protein